MEVNKTNGYSYELFNSNINPNASPIKSEYSKTQNVTFRRRCRSECLQMTPIIGIPLEISSRVCETRCNTNNIGLLNKSNMRRTSTDKKNLIDKKSMKDHTKENLTSTISKSSSPDIYDIRESYIREIELLKDIPTNVTSQKRSEYQTGLDQGMHKNRFHSEFYKRRVRTRTRSESEPHEIYNTKPTNSIDNNLRDDVSIHFMKRNI